MTHKMLITLLVGALLLGGSATPAAAADRPIKGSGSTFAQIMIDQWKSDAAAALGIQVDYTANGSGAGRNQFGQRTVDWASSDIPYLGEPYDIPPRQPFAYLPLVAGGTALMYNVRDGAGARIDGLRFNGDLVAKIFSGQINNWRDPAILAVQSQAVAQRLPDLRIRRVVRAEASGTTAVFMQYMAAIAPATMQAMRQRFGGDYRTPAGTLWTDVFPGGQRPDSEWAFHFTYVSGSHGVANAVASNNSNGYIGYAEAGFAAAQRLPVAFIQNRAGNFTLPTARNVAVALLEARRNRDGTQNLAAVFTNPRPESYPISSYNYAIVPTSQANPDVGSTLGKFLIHSVTVGQAKAAPLGYSPLPPNLVQQGFDVIRQIRGAPDPGPLGNWGRYYLDLGVGRIQRGGPGIVSGGGAGAGGAAGNSGASNSGAGNSGGAGDTEAASRGGGSEGATSGAGSGDTTSTTGGANASESAAAEAAASGQIDATSAGLAIGDLSQGSVEALTSRYILRDGRLMLMTEDGELVAVDTPKGRGVRIYLGIAGAVLAITILPPLVMGTRLRSRFRWRARNAPEDSQA